MVMDEKLIEKKVNLFIIYINDLPNSLIFGTATLFADDTCILFSSISLKVIEKALNKDLKRLFKWLCCNKISLNIYKTEVLLFQGPHKTTNDIRLKLNWKFLSLSNSVKYLGVHLDKFLSWNKHLENLSSKLRKTNGLISKLRHSAQNPKSKIHSSSILLCFFWIPYEICMSNMGSNHNKLHQNF